MSKPAPRTNLPEPLSGMTEQPVVELAGRPWLTLSEINRLVRQQGLATALAKAWLLDELVRAIPLDPEREHQLVRDWVEQRGVNTELALDVWLEEQQLQRRDLVMLATQAERLERFRCHRWGADVEVEFLRRKSGLDQACYSLLRVRDRALAEELHQRLVEQEASFADLAAEFSLGKEKYSMGIIGPLQVSAAHPELAGRLRIAQPGQLFPPFVVEDFWVVMRLESRHPAKLNTSMRSKLIEELYDNWLQDRIGMLINGEHLPDLPPMPGVSEDLSENKYSL